MLNGGTEGSLSKHEAYIKSKDVAIPTMQPSPPTQADDAV